MDTLEEIEKHWGVSPKNPFKVDDSSKALTLCFKNLGVKATQSRHIIWVVCVCIIQPSVFFQCASLFFGVPVVFLICVLGVTPNLNKSVQFELLLFLFW